MENLKIICININWLLLTTVLLHLANLMLIVIKISLFTAQNANDISFAKQSVRNKAYEKLVAAKTAISGASPAFWKCDPRRHEEGETYEQFKELLQVKIIFIEFTPIELVKNSSVLS